MPLITLPDGNTIEFPNKVTGLEVAEKISKSLSKQATIISVNEELKDLSFVLDKDCSVKIFTSKDKEGLETIRHDTAHITAMAVQELFPGTQVTIGPIIENGFYYDFSRKEPFTEDDLNKIENKMKEIVDRDVPTTREVWKRDKAISHFKDKGEIYKAEIIESIPQGEDVSIYFHGDWHDLCRGPHLSSTGKIGKYFKLTKVSGAYWRGDSNNEMLQRIYGTSWASQKDLDEYLKRIEEAEKRDHRKLGKEMDLFHFREESPGSVFWHEKGWKLFQKLVAYMRARQEKAGYKEVNTPEILDRSLWEKSGHWEKYGEHMYTSQTPDEKIFAIKPMNCPGHVQVFNQGLKSYRDLPLRISEFGKVHRYEPSGALHGLLRVRAFTQDDAHIFCTEDQITSECLIVTNLILDIYKDLGFEDVILKYSDRPDLRVGDDNVWDKAEKALLDAVKASKLQYTINKGEGAFYGPKIEFVLRDAIGRDWQCGTLQVDLNLPGRLDASFVDKDGTKKIPVMLHRALFGSLERFIGILIENYAGKFPFWIAPLQVVVIPISEEFDSYAKEVNEKINNAGISSEVDLKNHNLNYKIREHSLSKIPLLLICGKKEVDSNSVTIRRLDTNKQENMELNLFLETFSALNKASSN
ncbi:threonine--tRNA ligase [Candidatus Pelagibacter ubique]|uniref:Threonine--tRNA ligase n=1 Tax=Pelagibacter ubique (strain HTCC1062) TaxID=335992 RepID=SYT_PELUB|nr:threonine--tRNA ligase [Candidatus Pelagibacter ubique]Q4FNH9.1 RecName: Full=Threonine--tRNA ligase; AltName: Full=Threonyl-tRNA synthetase; Short=ThrRS [Candidatus Pelagibacter ubique HTCC1062]AAZ21260.1 Threonyl-tRNA synthetase [Candidatus Pelagibacter ubique HTCC1062]MDA7468724.1 threonine--tRNA ligase [Candidatus Pelagibacter ubique]MDB9710861.1 threonine--tRNA ligase [Candidatus Pelagibacter ubique]MDC0391933.1 threonine--tRNA ligase [Candidatus Pelagibacter ubique]MDC1169145.1 threo